MHTCACVSVRACVRAGLLAVALDIALCAAGVPLYAHLVQQLMRAAAYPADGADLDDEDEFIRFREQVRTHAR